MVTPTRSIFAVGGLLAALVAGPARVDAQFCSPSCSSSEVCNESTGECFELDLNCPAGGPIAQLAPEAIGIATNELADGHYFRPEPPSRADLLAAAGVRRAQIAISWSIAQPESGAPFDWTEADRRINALTLSGLDPVVVLEKPPAWAQDACFRIQDQQAWRAFVHASVARYGSGPGGTGAVRNWQVENEPNLGVAYSLWPPGEPPPCAPTTDPPYPSGPSAYASLLQAAMDEVHAVDSGGRVWGPSVVWHVNNDGCGLACSTWPEMLESSQPMQYLNEVLIESVPDVVSVHIYEPDPERLLDVYLAVVDKLARREKPLRSIPIVVNEGHFGFALDRTFPSLALPSPNGGCAYNVGADLLAQDVASFYACLLGTNVSEVLWFNGNDRYTPTHSCVPDNIRRTGVLGFDGVPNSEELFPPPLVKNAYYALRAIQQAQAERAVARARLVAVPSTCRIEDGNSCTSTLFWARRDYVGALQVWRDGLPVLGACTPAKGIHGQVSVQLSSAPATFELRASEKCTSSPQPGLLLDRVIARGDADLEDRPRGAIFALDSPCFIPPGIGSTACPMSLVWWSNGTNAETFPKVKIFAGGSKYLCVDAGTAGIVRTPEGADMWNNANGILFRIYEAQVCDGGETGLGRLLAATRGFGVSLLQ